MINSERYTSVIGKETPVGKMFNGCTNTDCPIDFAIDFASDKTAPTECLACGQFFVHIEETPIGKHATDMR